MHTPRAQRNARLDMMLFDHGALRVLWRNMHEVDAGVWRSSQPDPAMLRRLAGRGFRGVLNLRGATLYGSYLLEREICQILGLRLVDFEMTSRRLPSAETILALDRIFTEIPRPFVMHCKSGADRSGFAAALYLMLQADASVERALLQLSWRYLHIRRSSAGVLRTFFEAYGAANAREPIAFREWLRSGYDPDALMSAYASGTSADLLAGRLLRRE
jgi:protein tyrosine/serine phosphatase